MRYLRFLPSTSTKRLLIVVVITGLAGGAVGAAYLAALRALTNVLGPDAWTSRAHLVVLVAVGAVIGLLVRWLGAPAGVELLVDNIHVLGGPDEGRGLRSLIPASLLGVAAGGSLGPEAPLVTATGVLGSSIARKVGFDRDPLRVVTITGMAAGFTVLFGAPLGSAVFSLEILHRRGMEYHEALMPAVIGALCGYGVAAAVGMVGLQPIWRFPTVSGLGGIDLAYAVAAGVVGAVIAIIFTYLTIGLRRVVGVVPPNARPAVGGAVFAGLALISPYALTNGEVQIEHLITHPATVSVLLIAAAVKLVSSSVGVVCGWRGGFIIPLFFVGFVLGRAADHVVPGHGWAIAAALMVAANVGVTKTPLGSTLVVSEMAGLALLPTTLIAAMVSLALTSDVGLIDTQRRRLDIDGSAAGAGSVDEEIHGDVFDLDGVADEGRLNEAGPNGAGPNGAGAVGPNLTPVVGR